MSCASLTGSRPSARPRHRRWRSPDMAATCAAERLAPHHTPCKAGARHGSGCRRPRPARFRSGAARDRSDRSACRGDPERRQSAASVDRESSSSWIALPLPRSSSRIRGGEARENRPAPDQGWNDETIARAAVECRMTLLVQCRRNTSWARECPGPLPARGERRINGGGRSLPVGDGSGFAQPGSAGVGAIAFPFAAADAVCSRTAWPVAAAPPASRKT